MPGLITSGANSVLYLMDYKDGKSTKVCSGDFLVAEMEKKEKMAKKESAWDDYISILFKARLVQHADKTC